MTKKSRIELSVKPSAQHADLLTCMQYITDSQEVKHVVIAAGSSLHWSEEEEEKKLSVSSI